MHGVELRTADAIAFLEAAGHPERREYVDLPTTRRVARSQPQPPCLPDVECEPVSFTYGTLPMRPFSGGHTWFNQNVGTMQGHELPQNEPVSWTQASTPPQIRRQMISWHHTPARPKHSGVITRACVYSGRPYRPRVGI